MLNYNLNINSPLQQAKKNEDVRPPINWDFHSFASASDSTDLSERTFATMSINTPNTNCIQVSIDSGNSFVSDAQAHVTASVTGSNWPITGSTTMSLFTAGITFDPLAVDQFYFASVSASGTQIIANPSISASIITNKFLSSEFYRWYVSGSVLHMKGNVFNPLVNWKASNKSPVTTTGNINGYTSSFNIVKDENVPLVNINEVTASISSSFLYQYNFGVTASLTASINNVTGSTTMSIEIPETGVSASQQWFNPFTTEAKLTGSFVATNNNPYNITASVTFNKGNINNPLVNVIATGSVNQWNYYSGSKTILNIVKDINVPVSMSIGYITGSQISSFDYAYNFGVTASLTGSPDWPVSASYIYPTMSLLITGSDYFENIISYSTSSIITASFVATNNNPYTIKASINARYIPAFSASFTLFAAGGDGANSGYNEFPGGGGGAGAMYTGSFNIVPNRLYTINVGANASGSGNTTFTGYDSNFGIDVPVSISLQRGNNASSFNGGNSGTGSFTIGGITTLIPLVSGGLGENLSGGGTIRYAAGGGAGSSTPGVNGQATNRISGAGGNGISGIAGGGGGGGADRQNFAGATAGGGGNFGGGTGGNSDTGGPLSDGTPGTAYGAGGGGASNTQIGQSADGGKGFDGVLVLNYIGSGSRFTTTNATISYDGNSTTYIFATGSGTFMYDYEPVDNPISI